MTINYALDLSFDEWETWCLDKKLAKFTAKQIYQWIFQKKTTDPNLFSNLSKKVREELKASFFWELPHIHTHLTSVDGSEKLLLKTHDNLLIEMVVMPYDKRTTLCLSCQVGCKMGCTFCQTGKMGLKRNLSSGEILAQLILANQIMSTKVTNIVFMGMGEPLDNYDAVVKACKIMLDPTAFALSTRRVTISTSGIIPEIVKLGKELPVRLAISLHTADDAKRSAMMPVNRKYPLSELKKALLDYPAPTRYGITFEYVMIQGENDHIADAKKLVKFLHGLKAKVNLIPINHFPGIEMEASSYERIKNFQAHLTHANIPAPVRYSKGTDVSGGCGQLAAKKADELHKDPRIIHRERRHAQR